MAALKRALTKPQAQTVRRGGGGGEGGGAAALKLDRNDAIDLTRIAKLPQAQPSGQMGKYALTT